MSLPLGASSFDRVGGLADPRSEAELQRGKGERSEESTFARAALYPSCTQDLRRLVVSRPQPITLKSQGYTESQGDEATSLLNNLGGDLRTFLGCGVLTWQKLIFWNINPYRAKANFCGLFHSPSMFFRSNYLELKIRYGIYFKKNQGKTYLSILFKTLKFSFIFREIEY